jgi:LPXTG-motif cell wall-anchored protein
MSTLRTRLLAVATSFTSIIGLLFLALAGGGVLSTVPANNISDQNQPGYWENLYPGTTCIKLTQGFSGDTFVVNAPPAGTIWRIVDLKFGTVHETHDFPNQGDVLTTSTGQNISHVMECYTSPTTTSSSTSSSTTSTTQATTTSATQATTTSTQATTTTAPSTTSSSSTSSTSSSTTTTAPSTTTTDPSTTTTAQVLGTTIVNSTTTDPVAPSSTTTATVLGTTLAHTGDSTGLLLTVGALLIGFGAALLLSVRRRIS